MSEMFQGFSLIQDFENTEFGGLEMGLKFCCMQTTKAQISLCISFVVRSL